MRPAGRHTLRSADDFYLLIHSAGKKPTVDDKNLSGYIRGSIRNQVDSAAGNLVCLSKPLHGRPRLELSAAVGVQNQLAIQCGRKNTGRDCVHANLVRCKFDRQLLGQPADPGLAYSISGNLGKGDEGRKRGNVQDLSKALADHRLAKNLAGAPGTAQVDVEHAVPVLFGAIQRRGLEGDARGIDQNVDFSKSVQNLALQQLNGSAVTDIHGRTQGA